MYRLFIAALMLSACSAYMPAAPAGSRLASSRIAAGAMPQPTLAPEAQSRAGAVVMNSEYETARPHTRASAACEHASGTAVRARQRTEGA